MSKPLVSILMTSFNREKYIGDAIESVLASTYNDFELIIVDDKSLDNTVEIARNYASKDNRLRVFVNENNLGDYPNRNKAATYAKGEYLKYVDADDFIYPWGLQLLVEMMEKFPDAGFGLCSLDQDNNRPFPFQLEPRDAYLYHYCGKELFHKAPLSSIIRRNVFETEGGFQNIRMAGDFEMWHRLAAKYPIVLMPHGIVWYRRHGDQELNSYLNYVKVYERIKKNALLSKNCPLSAEYVKEILSKNRSKNFKNLIRSTILMKRKDIIDSWKRLND